MRRGHAWSSQHQSQSWRSSPVRETAPRSLKMSWWWPPATRTSLAAPVTAKRQGWSGRVLVLRQKRRMRRRNDLLRRKPQMRKDRELLRTLSHLSYVHDLGRLDRIEWCVMYLFFLSLMCDVNSKRYPFAEPGVAIVTRSRSF